MVKYSSISNKGLLFCRIEFAGHPDHHAYLDRLIDYMS